MKKLLAVGMIVLLSFTLAGCSGGNQTQSQEPSDPSTKQEGQPDAPDTPSAETYSLNGLTVSYPIGWTVKETDTSTVFVSEDSGSQFTIILDDVVDAMLDDDGELNMTNAETVCIDAIKAGYKEIGFSLDDDAKSVEKDGTLMYRASYTGMLNKKAIQGDVYICVTKSNVYNLFSATYCSEYKNYSDDEATIFESIKIKY